jgi:CheY-like chemotaxis protein
MINMTDSPTEGFQPVATRILLVEDNQVNAEIVYDYLSSKGFAVTLANDGLDALQAVDTTRPHLILMDIHMQSMDGLEAIRRIRQHADPQLATTPIIALTALAMASDRERCLAAGASDYLSKPVGLRELLGTIYQHLQLPASPA